MNVAITDGSVRTKFNAPQGTCLPQHQRTVECVCVVRCEWAVWIKKMMLTSKLVGLPPQSHTSGVSVLHLERVRVHGDAYQGGVVLLEHNLVVRVGSGESDHRVGFAGGREGGIVDGGEPHAEGEGKRGLLRTD